MIALLFVVAIATPLAVLSESTAENPAPVQKPVSQTPLNNPPQPGGNAAGRFQVAMLKGEGGSNIAIRIDTFTGESWTLNHTTGESTPVPGKDNLINVTYVDYWRRSLEPAAMEEINRRERARVEAKKNP